jgi:HlyD family secretion protein
MRHLSSPRNLSNPGARRRGGWPLRLIIVIGVLGLAALATAFIRKSDKASGAGTEAAAATEWPVQQGSMVVSILNSGQIRARQVTMISCEVPGDVKILWVAEEGSYVQKGDKLVELESSELREEILDQKIDEAAAKADLEAAERDLELQKRKNETDFLVAQNRLEMAKLAQDKFLKGDQLQRLRDLEAQITVAEAQLKRAEDQTTWTQRLLDKGYVNRGELEADQLDLTRNKLDLEKAKTARTVYEDYEIRSTQMELQIALTEAQQDLETMKVTQYSEVRKREVALESAKSRLELQQAQLAQRELELAKTVIYAPQEGMVVYSINQQRGRGGSNQDQRIEIGATVRNRQQLIELPDFSAWVVQTNVHESMIQQVRLGQKVLITLEAFPNEILQGRVGRIALLPDSTQWFTADVKEYKVDVELSSTTLPLKPGMSAKAEIILDNLEDVVRVPLQAITARESQTYVLLKGVEGPRIQDVVVGMNNGRFAEIKSGLKVGDVVLMTERLGTTGSMIDRPSERSGVDMGSQGGGAAGPPDAANSVGRGFNNTGNGGFGNPGGGFGEDSGFGNSGGDSGRRTGGGRGRRGGRGRGGVPGAMGDRSGPGDSTRPNSSIDNPSPSGVSPAPDGAI